MPRGVWYKGQASYYHATGNPTASGEAYDEWAMTAAMHGVKYGTVVTVEYLDSQGNAISSLNVRVNDHGPWVREGNRWVPHPTRVIDLSPNAFDKLTGNIYLGVVPVKVYVP